MHQQGLQQEKGKVFLFFNLVNIEEPARRKLNPIIIFRDTVWQFCLSLAFQSKDNVFFASPKEVFFFFFLLGNTSWPLLGTLAVLHIIVSPLAKFKTN